jgi:hypothetical protein
MKNRKGVYKMIRILLSIRSIVLAIIVAGCVAQPSRTSLVADPYTSKKFNAPVGREIEVNTGEALFVEGSYIEGEAITVSEPVDLMIPGSMMIPFPVHINAGLLELSRIDSSWKYYCAQNGKAAASFPGLGSVIREGDCVGIRTSLDGTQKRWVVDNSNYNRMETIWDKSLNASDASKYTPKPSQKPFKIKNIRRIIFNGYYGGQLHFTWEEIIDTSKESKEFTFDFAEKPTPVGIKGNQFNIISADNTKLVYKWVKFD